MDTFTFSHFTFIKILFIVLSFKDYYNVHKPNTVHSQQPFWIPMVAGGTARIWAATLVSPLELIRTKMQSQKLSYGGIFFLIHLLDKSIKNYD